ncbi:ABC transporter ATP-binding protein [Thermofilum pendens]|uniref:Molybdate/tungstate import ATP-binding protein WtpC n=1 Tax=Thermofilum pendens (strain DSM 2475 / Hrk 5) TaxID=368408 RepID=A1S0G9_THEPD|nr:ABC transporter ATP-binding protein [Thermofilum pendens]ABL78949.1 spermidine/putrescine ABC transporter ATPase subunit [Thermofilum pendens Hrk 5]
MPYLSAENLVKRYGKVLAVDHVSFSVERGEMLGLLGPSGCGKTTTLRIIAGLTVPDEGRVLVEGEDITNAPPEKRGMGMVFQNYALWPHMTVYDNVAFPLRARGMPADEVQRRVKEALEIVRLYELKDRYPHQLSGGQQQRVALARALAVQPRVILLDEPLSNLDAKLREEMRFELKELQRKLGVTAVYVTHDQAEALALSDRIAVMKDGRIVQIGTPREIYEEPANAFVADFIGKINFLEGRIEEFLGEGYVLVRVGDGLYVKAYTKRVHEKAPVIVGVRPGYIELRGTRPEKVDESRVNVFEGVVVRKTYLGDVYDYRVRVSEGVTLRVEARENYDVGSKLYLVVPADRTLVIDKKTGWA